MPSNLPVPAGLPAALRASLDWPALPPLARLVAAPQAGRDAVAAAWDEARPRAG